MDLNPLIMIDWYDGPVLAVCAPSWRSDKCIANTIAWSSKTKNRVLTLLPISDSDIDFVQREQVFTSQVAKLQQVASASRGDVELVWLDIHGGVVSRAVTSRDDVHALLLSDIEGAAEDARQVWFERF